MITPSEAVRLMDIMIKAMPDKNQVLGFLISKDIAQALIDYTNHLSFPQTVGVAYSGMEFNWKGIKCKVA